MKVAICFSGAIRNFDDCISSIFKYFINNFDSPDIFLHMWTLNKSDTNLDYAFKWRKDNSDIERIIKILNPIKYVIEEYGIEHEKNIKESSCIDMDKFDTEQKKNYGFNCCSMYWKIMKCFELVEEHSILNGVKYDLVIRARLDFIWEDHIKPNDFVDLNDSKIYLIRDRYATCSKLETNDKFFAGTFLAMSKMSKIFNQLQKYQSESILIEGQTINEIHIKRSHFIVHWIGHSKTYFKFMLRHKVLEKNKTISIDLKNFTNDFVNQLAYNFMDKGYHTYISNNFQPFNYNVICPRYINNISNISYTIYNDNQNIIIKSLKKTIKLNIDNCIFEQLNLYISDFIISLLDNFMNSIEEYIFNKIIQINNIEKDELVRFKYMDHGYYICKYDKFDKKEHYVIFDNKSIKVSRDSFKIINLIKYYTKGVLPYN